MKTCANPVCDSTELVYSGVDAFLLGIQTETWCYTCANAIHSERANDKANVG